MRRRLGVALFALLPAALLLASEGEGHGAAAADHTNAWLIPVWGVPTLVWLVINFALAMGLLYFLLRKAAAKFFAERVKSIQGELTAAQREKEEALERLREVEAKMAALSEEIATIEREASETAVREKERIRQEAEAARERIRREAADEVARQVDEATRALRAEAVALAEAAARDILARTTTPEDDARLAERFFAQLGEKR